METTWIISSAVWRWSHSWPQCSCWPQGTGRLESHLVVAVYLCRFFTLDQYSEILRRKRELYAYCRYETRRVEELANLAKLLPTALTGLCGKPDPEEWKPQSWVLPLTHTERRWSSSRFSAWMPSSGYLRYNTCGLCDASLQLHTNSSVWVGYLYHSRVSAVPAHERGTAQVRI